MEVTLQHTHDNRGSKTPENPQYEFAGFWIRFVAKLLDSLIIGAVSTALFLLIDFGGLLTWVVYTALLHGSPWQATVGKKILGLRVIRADGRNLTYGYSAWRSVAELASWFTFLIGYLIAAFTPEKQALHDFIADTRVIADNRGN